jgi:hypothetical protein
MAIESPLKKETAEATQLLDKTNKAYQKYFISLEKLPPLELRKELDTKIAKLKSDMNKVHQTGVRFLITGLVARYHTHVSQWDKTMKDIEEGRFHRQPRRV